MAIQNELIILLDETVCGHGRQKRQKLQLHGNTFGFQFADFLDRFWTGTFWKNFRKITVF